MNACRHQGPLARRFLTPLLGLLMSIVMIGGLQQAALAKGGTTPTTSSKSFSSGFSSGKAAAPAAPAAKTVATKTGTGFGTFGSKAADEASASKAAPTSAMGRDLTANASKAAALKTLDERTAARAARDMPATPQSPAYSKLSRYGERDVGAAVQPAPPVVIYNNTNSNGSSGFIPGMVIGSMLHSNGNAQGANYGSAPVVPNPMEPNASSGSFSSSGSVMGFLFKGLLLIAVIGLTGYALWKAFSHVERSATPGEVAAKKQPNYRL